MYINGSVFKVYQFFNMETRVFVGTTRLLTSYGAQSNLTLEYVQKAL
jgi:hypothetical protein